MVCDLYCVTYYWKIRSNAVALAADLVHRMSMSGGKVDSGLLETGKAVVIAALTNIAAFGTLALGNYPALRSFGMVAFLGSLSCLFTALTLVPALMARKTGD